MLKSSSWWLISADVKLAPLSEEKTLPQGECRTYCFCVLSVWNYKSVTIKTRRGTLTSICKARDSCHARCSSFTRVKPTFTASARLIGPSFLERAEEKLATVLIVCTRVFYALSYLCPGKALLVLLLWWLWRSAFDCCCVVSAHVRSSASEWERDYYILRLSYEWQLPNTEECYIVAS